MTKAKNNEKIFLELFNEKVKGIKLAKQKKFAIKDDNLAACLTSPIENSRIKSTNYHNKMIQLLVNQ